MTDSIESFDAGEGCSVRIYPVAFYAGLSCYPYSVTLVDDDTGQSVGDFRFFPSFDAARSYAVNLAARSLEVLSYSR